MSQLQDCVLKSLSQDKKPEYLSTVMSSLKISHKIKKLNQA